MKNKILNVVLIGLLLAAVMVFAGCGGYSCIERCSCNGSSDDENCDLHDQGTITNICTCNK